VKKILFFSNNKNKKKEINNMFKNSNLDILNLEDFKKIKEPIENASSFEENAKIKSKYGFRAFSLPCFADDSGICISALNNLPGIKSKRFIDENGGIKNTFKLIFKNISQRSDNKAYFKTSISLTINEKNTLFFNGVVGGEITEKPRGENGFGYDPIFVPDGYNKTFAEMTSKEKNNVSHRFIAINKLKNYLLNSFS